MNIKPDNIEQLARQLPSEIMPARDLWPGIAARLQPAQPRRDFWRYGVAATVLVACGALAVWLAATPVERGGEVVLSVPVQDNTVANPAVQFAALKPQPRATLSSNYRVVERATLAIEAALEKDPNNPYLRSLLNQTYQDQAALLRAAERAQTNPYLRTDL